MARLVNYFGQLRMYSYADLLLLLLAVHAGLSVTVAVSLLWFGFLIQLEWRHRDRGRLPWHWSAWVVPWAVAPVLAPTLWIVCFYLLAILYTLKKRFPAAAAVSPLLNGGLKAALLLVALAARQQLASSCSCSCRGATCWATYGTRARTRPGRTTTQWLPADTRNTPWVYPAGLACTSAAWMAIGSLPVWWLVPVFGAGPHLPAYAPMISRSSPR